MKNSIIDDAYNCNYLFYSIIGPHGKESVETIITRKQIEIKKTGFSLWAAKIDKKSITLSHNLKKTDKVFVLCKINEKTKDPTKKKEVITAQKMYTPEGEKSIPKTIKTTYGKGSKYQAYIVKKYQLLEDVIDFDFEKFEAEYAQKSNEVPKSASFKTRFENFNRFQNTFGRRNNSLCGSCTKQISVIMELEYPFVVDIE